MHLEEIVIDGFKSYAARTTLKGFSPHFNAITGLNGSGKSNILDSICFVLGLNSSNLSQVRAQSLNDLVYKKGQAGIVRASVSVTFLNNNPDQCPVGFEKCERITVTRQIVIGGKNKYLVNGSQAHQNTIQNLFQSVQLNINNPHFLIMQGRITQVLNMKPQEVLGLIEEAAGTRMFEEKKEKALKTIEKKELKVQEISDLMENDIAPKLDKLKQEKQEFLSFQKVEAEVERLKMLVVAYDYHSADQLVQEGEDMLKVKQQELDESEQKIAQLEQDQVFCTQRIAELHEEKSVALKKSGKFTALQGQVAELSNQLTRMQTQKDLLQSNIEDEKKQIKELLKQKKLLADQISKATVKVEASTTTFEAARGELDDDVMSVKKQQGFLQTLTTGIADAEGQENGFAEQIEAAQKQKSKASTENEQAKQRQRHIQQQLKSNAPKAYQAEKDQADNIAKAEDLRIRIDNLKKQKVALKFDPDREGTLKKGKNGAISKLRELQSEIDSLSSKLSRLDFRYDDPSPNFDRRKVKGALGKLIQMEDNKLEYCLALQICAGDRLNFVVVDDNRVASDLLKNGNLQNKHTFIPLKQIVANQIPDARLRSALNAAPGKVESALNLVNYSKDVEPAMKFVFGGTMICKDASAAKKVSYDKTIRLRSITTDGDVYDPGAVITGGSASTQTNVLDLLHQYQKLDESINAQKEKLRKVNEELEAYQSVVDSHSAIESELRQKEYELKTVDQLMQNSSAGQLIAEVAKMKQELVSLAEAIELSNVKHKEADANVKALEKEMREFAGNRDGKLKKFEKDLQKSKDALAKKTAQFKTLSSAHESLVQDLEQLQTDMTELETAVKTSNTNIETTTAELDKLVAEVENLQSEYEDKNSQLQAQSQLFSQFDKDIKSKEVEKKQKSAQVTEIKLTLKQLQFDLEKLQKDQADAEGLAAAILEANDWINDQKQNFGRSNTVYDFDKQDIPKSRKDLKRLEGEHEQLRKRINIKVMNMIDRVVQKERSLKEMLDTVKKDKQKIEETIEQLDHYKREALHKTWQKVNGDFGDIFNDLLPGNSAKLVPPEGQTVNEGLEVKVRLGDVWKQSLTELSGGQRSLVALSLILSLLQFKPAPMYILDEIDAALDLSHTQNIGHLFKSRFKGSQFIVVSLKEGMFNNADVLFRASFRDGSSVVDRHEQQNGKLVETADKENTSQVASTQKPAVKKARRKA